MQNKLTDVWMATSRHNKQPHPKCSHGPLTQAPTSTFTVSLSSLSPFCVSYFMKHVEIRPLEIMLCQSQPCLDSGEWMMVCSASDDREWSPYRHGNQNGWTFFSSIKDIFSSKKDASLLKRQAAVLLINNWPQFSLMAWLKQSFLRL